MALRSARGNKSDPAIKDGVRWLLNQIGKDYEQIRHRVNADVANQKAMEAEKRKERAERVRRIKEERERFKTNLTVRVVKPVCLYYIGNKRWWG